MKKQKGFTLYELLIVVVIMFAVATGGVKLIGKFTTDHVVATVSEKGERCQSRDSCKYLVYTDKGVFQNTDSLISWKFDSADFYNDMKVGKTYDMKVTGWRVPFLSWYPNVVGFTEVQ